MANHLQASVTLPHQSVFAAGVRDLGRKRDLCGNRLSLFAIVTSNLGRKGGLGAKMSHVTRNSKKNTQNSYYYLQQAQEPYWIPLRNCLQQLGEPARQLRQFEALKPACT